MSDLGQQSLRGFLATLERNGALMRRRESVDPRFEVAAYLNEIWDGPAVLFEALNGSELPLVGNVLNSVERIATGLGTTPSGVQRKIIAAIDRPIAPQIVAAGPCQEVTVTDPDLGLCRSRPSSSRNRAPISPPGRSSPATAGPGIATSPSHGSSPWAAIAPSSASPPITISR